MNPSFTISGYGKALEAKTIIEKNIKENFEELNFVLPLFLNDQSLANLKDLCQKREDLS